MSISLLRRKASMESIRLTNLDISVGTAERDADNIEVEFKAEGRLLQHGERPDAKKLLMSINVESPNNDYYDIEAVAEAIFVFAEDADGEYLATYMSRYAPNEVVGFLRSYLASATAVFPYGAVDLPGFNITLDLAN